MNLLKTLKTRLVLPKGYYRGRIIYEDKKEKDLCDFLDMASLSHNNLEGIRFSERHKIPHGKGSSQDIGKEFEIKKYFLGYSFEDDFNTRVLLIGDLKYRYDGPCEFEPDLGYPTPSKAKNVKVMTCFYSPLNDFPRAEKLQVVKFREGIENKIRKLMEKGK